ncbi:lipopolysaccharide biosynthesis protein RfbH [Desulfonatronovibrio magnus]|uniref:lipopolysaccharide biosynthesis protein RfbH n=1 Tax=Desulfonatronovibrio magnus TaxID=698827 RepID=UPI000A778074|nr:lipopolysaccharide biosynthesis protein RfbH [Desulfonatronovibrio magnus]
MDSDNRIGEIVLMEFPYTNAKGSKVRPAVIVFDNSMTGVGRDLTVAYMTTEIDRYRHVPVAVLVERSDLDSGWIKDTSVIRTDKLLTIDENSFMRTGIARLNQQKIQELLKSLSRTMVSTFYQSVHKPKISAPFTPGVSRVNYAGRVFDEAEMCNLVDSSLEFWLTYGRYSREFEKRLAEFLSINYAFLVNSGSSANLLAFMALTSPLLENKAMRRGDEVITVAAGFPTTVAPIIQYGAVPVFVDVDLATFNIDVTQLEAALSSRTKVVMLAHTLGNPFDIQAVKSFCDAHNLWLIEDNCDALGSKYQGRYTGTWGDIGTSSFYPPHHMTMGEGGAVYTNDNLLKKIILSMRDWGRDCWCESGVDNTCGCRFSSQHGTLPFGYDHKYVYSHFGYNLKPSDMQAAIGCAQLDKLETFTARRRENFNLLRSGLADLDRFFHLPEPTPGSDPSWFGFFLTLKDGVPFTRNQIVEHLEAANIQTRNLFAGNITRHPCFMGLKEGVDFRIVGELAVTDKIMNDSFWIGVYPGMKQEVVEYMVNTIRSFVENL